MMRRRAAALELIDGPVDISELAGTFRDIAFSNRAFGGIAAVRSALRGLRPANVLDVGTGAADIPISLRIRAERDVRYTCLDANEAVLTIARDRAGGDRGVTFVHGDGRGLPFGDASFDVAMCNLTLHHLAPAEAIELLRELRRVSRIAPVVTDLVRSPLSWFAAFAFSVLFSRNRLTRHDAPLSALRAYTSAEALDLARNAGWRSPRVRTFGLIRMVLTDAP